MPSYFRQIYCFNVRAWAKPCSRRIPVPTELVARVRPNPSVNRTRSGRRRKAGVRRLRHLRTPALRRLPPRAGYLER